jgi:hypothetical protein
MKKYFIFLSEPEIKLILKGLSEVPIIAPAPANPLTLKTNIIEQCKQLDLELTANEPA